MEKIFEEATRRKYRFPYKGQCTVEDLWDISVTQLDNIFKALNAEKKQVNEESLLEVKSAEDQELENKIAIVRYVVSTKQKEAAQKALARERKQQREQIMSILADKETEDMKNMTKEQLMAKLNELGE